MVYTKITGLGSSLNIAASMPQISTKSICTSHRRTIMLPFVDHICQKWIIDLVKHIKIALVPSITAVTDSSEPIEELARIYCSDLQTPSLIMTE